MNRDERGQTLVEFALVIPIALLLMVGLFDLGRIVFINNSLSDGARHGARHATIDPRATDYCSLIDDAVRTAIRSQPLSTYTVTYTVVQADGSDGASYLMCANGSDGAGKAAMAADRVAAPGDRVTVDLGADVNLALAFVARAAGAETFALDAESTMQVTFAPRLSAP
jgi:Flp pilus assembly protein TadG